MRRSIFVFIVLAFLGNQSDKANGKVSKDRGILSEVDKRMKVVNKPAVRTIESADGDIIDCVSIYKQPAFDHPTMSNHTIQMRPSFHIASKRSSSPKNHSSKPTLSQVWQRSGSCPKGTVPIRRLQREDVIRATSLARFGKKTHKTNHLLNKAHEKPGGFASPFNPKDVQGGRPENRSEAFLLTVGYNYIGASADINVWNPSVEQGGEDYSAAQIWLFGGPGDNFESIESGWVVNPGLFGDSRTRFFAYWTKDAYKSAGCFNLLCSGFVQTTTQLALGGAIDPISSSSGPQYHISIGIFLDPITQNWWLKYGDIAIGYWPGNLFSYLSHSSILVQWGGEVYSPNVRKTPHTKTQMGSGNWAATLWGDACFITNVRIMDYSLQLKYPQWLGDSADEYDCYTTWNFREGYMSEPIFYFGGPGQNPRCP